MFQVKNNIPKWFSLASRLSVIALVFAIILSILMIANYLQTKSIDPLNSQALNQLMLKLQKEPENQALKEQIRALDLLARRAYFTNQWQIRTGSLILFISILIFLAALKYMNSMKTRFPDLENEPATGRTWLSGILARRYLTYIGLGLFGLALLAGIFSESEFINDAEIASGLNSYATLADLQNNWPSFRGAEGNGIAYQKNIPLYWNGETGENIVWKTPIPKPGFNSPIIWQDLILLSGADKTGQEVYGINRQTGKIKWQVSLNDIPGSPAKKPKVSGDTGYAAPSMVTDGQRVYVIFATGDIAALDFEGKRVWAKNLGQPDNHYGHSSSLQIYKNILLVQYDHNDGNYLIGFNVLNGAELYRTERDVQISWASPLLIDSENEAQVVLNSNPFVISYNPQNGKELWRVECMDGEVGPSPAYADGMVYVVNEFAILAAISLEGKPEVIWDYEDDLSEVASLLATPEYIIMATSFGPVTCFNAKTGEVYWMYEFEEGFYSSPVLAGGHVYLMDINGVTYIFKPDREFKLANQAPLDEKAMTIPAFMDGNIYIRGTENLYCVGN
jgi:outer membrane protein assembly factor BamB